MRNIIPSRVSASHKRQNLIWYCFSLVWGFTSYPNYDNLSPNACKQMCLANPACRSFISSLDYDEPVEGLPGTYATHDCGLSDITLRQAMDQGTLYIPYDPKWRPSPGDSQGFYDRGCPEFLPVSSVLKCFVPRRGRTNTDYRNRAPAFQPDSMKRKTSTAQL